MCFGAPAKASNADRSIELRLGDSYFQPERISVRPGETIRFVLVNDGELLHEFNLGTAAMHAVHQKEMLAMMDQGTMTATGIDRSRMGSHGSEGGHDDPNSVILEPGETRELVWKLSEPTASEFACNAPGHYEAGMHGKVEFTKPYKADS